MGFVRVYRNGDQHLDNVLTFTFRNDPNYWFLDNVSVTTGGITTPEPGTLVLFGSGIIGIAGVIRRKFRA